MKPKTIIISILVFSLLTGCAAEEIRTQGDDEVHIHDIQGCGHISPFRGNTIEGLVGIVTARSDNGFYVQGDETDDLACTSEAIFVYTQTYPDVLPGDKIVISGLVEEYSPGNTTDQNLSTTEIQAVEFRTLSRNNKLPTPIEIGGRGLTIPGTSIDNDELRDFQPVQDGIDFFESLEGMLVTISTGHVIGARNSYNEVVVLTDDSLGNNLISPEGALLMMEDDPNPERIILNMNSANNQVVNLGDTLRAPVIGIMDYEYGNFKINTFGKVDFDSSGNSEGEFIRYQTDSITLASLNVENLSLQESATRFRGIAELITTQMVSPDILILHEVLDDSGTDDDGTVSSQETIGKLIAAIRSVGGPEYKSIVEDPENNQDGGILGGNIRSVILFQPHDGIQLSMSGVLSRNPDRLGTDAGDFKNTRKPLVAGFQIQGREVVVIAIHLTSKGADSPLFGSEQTISEPEKRKRNAQARIISNFAEEIHQQNPDTLVIVAGDLNDYPWSETLSTLKGGGALNDTGDLILQQSRFSYIHDGNAFQFDYILTSDHLSQENMKFHILHVNSILDEIERLSDHDPVIFEFVVH
jgi:uncharacterized protein